jgi:hypothetical protein
MEEAVYIDELELSDLFTLTSLQLPKLSKITTLIFGVYNRF